MTTRPYPEGWRPTWARLAIFHEPSRGRYKLYAVEESNLEDSLEHRTAAERQPPAGFATLAKAQAALAEADPAAELAKLRRHGGTTRKYPDDAEVESVRACGDPHLRECKADPGGLLADLRSAFRAISEAVSRWRRGGALRVYVRPTGTDALLTTRNAEPAARLAVEPRQLTWNLIGTALGPLGITEADLLDQIDRAALPGQRNPARTLWNEPALVVCGMRDETIDLFTNTDSGPKLHRDNPPRRRPGTSIDAAIPHDRRQGDPGDGLGSTTGKRPAQPTSSGRTNIVIDTGAWTDAVDQRASDATLTRLVIRQLQRAFHAGTDADRRSMLAVRPRMTGTKWDAVAAASVEHTAITHGYDLPEWTEEDERFLSRPTRAIGVWNGADIAVQPGPFLRHGIIVDARDLDGRTGDGRKWVPQRR